MVKIGVWIHNFISNRQQCVAVNGTTSCEALYNNVLPSMERHQVKPKSEVEDPKDLG